MPDNDDKTVKELIDAATRAELEKWFSLPSFQQLAAEEAKAQAEPQEDPDVAEYRRKRAAAIAAVDPALLEAHRRRVEHQRSVFKFKPEIEPRVVVDMALLDQAMIDRQHLLAEPREYDLPRDLPDELREATPQALLRDLHRPELTFDKVFEIIDMASESRVRLRAIISEAMGFRRASLSRTESRFHEARALLFEARKERRKPWNPATMKLPNRRVTE